jgi:phosphomannomutase
MRPVNVTINPREKRWRKLHITDELASLFSLDSWADTFNLMTAGYRDQLDPADASSPKVAFNLRTVAILGEAKARVFKKKMEAGTDTATPDVHIGGETRPHTQDFICILARVYAAHGLRVHLRSSFNTTPIWYSSFGVFYEGFQSGDNLTASHSQFFKGGWKPMDSLGKQLVEEEEAIISAVRQIVINREEIRLAPWSSENILHDFDVDEAYLNYQKSVVDNQSIEEVRRAGKQGFRCAVCTVGGSMKLTSERLFHQLGIPTGADGIIRYFYDEEDSQYHKIGQIDGENFGVDPTKQQIYRSIGAQQKLLKDEADIVFIWDPDGDRFNMVTTASAAHSDQYRKFGLEVEQVNGQNKCIVYFTPNQIYFMLTAFRIDALKKSNQFNSFDWFIASSVTTSRALDELAEKENIPAVHVRVGFKHWGTFASWLENRKDPAEPYEAALREKIVFGKNPRLIIMCEESGGAVFGGSELLKSKTGNNALIAMREKDGFQFGLLTLCLSAMLFNSRRSFADHYCYLIEKKKIKNNYFLRYDKRLYDESLTGTQRKTAKKRGEAQRDNIMNFFNTLAEQYSQHKSLEVLRNEMNSRIPKRKKPLPLLKPLPHLKYISLIGEGGLLEGAFFQFDSFWFVIRASGTDAVIRYYLNGDSQDDLSNYQETLMSLSI